ncbi:hypothetical protein ACFY36_03870 [Actinoplanes sp. NPDC000266]
MSQEEPAPSRDYDGPYKALLSAYPREALQLLCGARLDDGDVVVELPTEVPRQRSLQCDRVFAIQRASDGSADVYHVEIQLKRTVDFQERMLAYFAGLALKHRPSTHRIHQVVFWPRGGGYPGRFTRDRVRLDYLSVDVTGDLDPGMLLTSALAPLALASRNAPPDVAERVADRIAATSSPEEKLVLVELGMLGESSLALLFLEALRRRGMNDVLEQSESGREIARRNLEQGEVNGMRALLRAKYGDFADLEALARRLAVGDHDGNIARIVAGASLDDLRS